MELVVDVSVNELRMAAAPIPMAAPSIPKPPPTNPASEVTCPGPDSFNNVTPGVKLSVVSSFPSWMMETEDHVSHEETTAYERV